MKYQCRECSFNIDGDVKIIQQVLEHEKTHPKHESDFALDDGTKPACSFCGCDVDHNATIKAFRHITYEDVIGNKIGEEHVQ